MFIEKKYVSKEDEILERRKCMTMNRLRIIWH